MKLLRIILGAGGALAAAFAFLAIPVLACTSLATLNTSQTQGAAGSDLTVTGSSFATITNGASAVSVHWNGVDGPVLAEVAPDASGSITASFKIPSDAQPGYYVLTATQNDKLGRTAFGTPGRLAFQVTGATGATSGSQAGGQPAASAPVGNGLGIGAGMIALLGGLGVLGLLLFGVGAASFVSSYRRAPAASPVKKD
ncbi:MAG: hypothetical protein NVS3B24_11540 [Candidatus Dormibacteria bacterium]